MRRSKNPNTFYDDANTYFFGVDGGRNDAPVIVFKNQEVVPLENPYHLAYCKKIGLFQFSGSEDSFSNAIGDKLKGGIKKVGGQITNAVKDTIQNPNKAIKNLGKEIQKGKEQFTDKAGNLIKKGVNAGLKVTLAVPRQAFLGLVALNFGGLATKYFNKTEEGKRQIIDKWENLGGDRGSLEGSFNTGSKKKPLFVSKKKRGQLAQKNKGFDGEYSNVMGWDDVLESITASLPILTPMISAFKKAPSQDPNIDADIDKQEEDNEKADGTLTADEQKALDQQIEKQKQDIINNPNLTQDEKNELLKALTSDESFFTKYKWYVWGGGLLLLGVVGYFAFKHKQE